MRKVIISISVVLYLATIGVFSQSGSVKGIVTDSVKGQPVINLTIFITSTTFGTTTNQSGEYHLDKLPPGDYTLMFRHLLYPPYSQRITIEAGKQVVLNVIVAEKTNLLNEVVIVGKKPDWDWAYKLFKENFLGDSYESKCILQNPKALSFYFDGDILTTNAKQPLEIINRHLGYRITYYLDYFKFVENKNPNKNSVQGAYYAYAGSALFKDLTDVMPLNAIAFRINREAEFKGSLRHFLSSLYQKNLDENRYALRKAYQGYTDLKETEKLGTAMAKVKLTQMDSIFSWYPESGESGFLYYFPFEDYKILMDQVKDGQKVGEKTLTTDTFVLVFKDFKKTYDLRDDWISTLRIINGDLTFDQLGNYWIHKGSITWTNLDNSVQIKVLLPSDYLPKTKPMRKSL
ncbi:MAG: carboxypeptidase-like regulatory domain-containing protein [Deltaproteobacteria bacterium]|nr:MAG: carboxypeptidase-like regulatory domain-containing protein [Deltaproteobacteria bacterium]